MTASCQATSCMKILVVEDTMMLADVLVDQLEDYGCSVVGPASHLNRGVALARTELLDGALLDVNLHGERCFPIAEVLTERAIPFAFLTGYGDMAISAKFQHVPRLTKPYSNAELTQLLERHFASAA